MPVVTRPGLCALVLACCHVVAVAGDCDDQLQQHLASDLSLSFEQFDQDDTRGWRALSAAGCDAQAVRLVDDYSARQSHPHPVIAWHRAQLLAKAGRTAEAIQATRQTHRPAGSDAATGFDWNDYADATIAFLQDDRQALQSARDRLAAASSGAAINATNLRAVDRLLRCFGQPYKVAYSCPEAP
jgi:hypothetical protein